MLQKCSNSKTSKFKYICINPACQKFNFGECYASNAANMVCAQFTSENGAHIKCGLNIDFYFSAITSSLLHKVEKNYGLNQKAIFLRQ